MTETIATTSATTAQCKAAIHEATLLSTDADFTHLDAVFFHFDQISAN